MAGDIFYSNVDVNLRKELESRAVAGFTSRTTKDLDFMLGKVANVELRAYDGNEPGEKNLAKTFDGGTQDPFAVLGGNTTATGSYLPSTIEGFLRGAYATNSYRIPPIITTAEINIGDHSMGLLNKASVNITVPDPTRDFDAFERIWFRPGRHATIIYEYPESAIINSGSSSEFLTDDTVPSEEKLEKQFPNDAAEIREELKKMNRVRFDGLITSFSFTYQQDGSVESTITFTGTSNVYTETSMLMKSNTEETGSVNTTDNKETGQQLFWTAVSQTVGILQEMEGKAGKHGYEWIQEPVDGDNYINDRNIIWGQNYFTGDQDKFKSKYQNELKYISLGLLIHLLNVNLLKKMSNTVTTPEIICNDDVCFSNVYKDLVSSDPSKILLWPGTGESKTNEYPGAKEIPVTIKKDGKNITKTLTPTKTIKWLGTVYPQSIGFIDGDKAYPSRIYIGLDSIKSILDNMETFSVKTVSEFLKQIGGLIYYCTGGAIKMVLITHPKLTNRLLYYDSKFHGYQADKQDVEPFNIPMFAPTVDDNGDIKTGTIARDVKISSKLPDNLKNLAYVLNEGTEISESDIAPFVAYMYADADQKEKIAENYKKTFDQNIKNLLETKQEFTRDPNSESKRIRLQKALIKFIQYPTDDIMESNKLSAPIYPFDVEFTTDGINGFKYGDVILIPILPSRYTKQTIFSIIGVTHNIDNTGNWSTKIKCIMRPSVHLTE